MSRGAHPDPAASSNCRPHEVRSGVPVCAREPTFGRCRRCRPDVLLLAPGVKYPCAFKPMSSSERRGSSSACQHAFLGVVRAAEPRIQTAYFLGRNARRGRGTGLDVCWARSRWSGGSRLGMKTFGASNRLRSCRRSSVSAPTRRRRRCPATARRGSKAITLDSLGEKEGSPRERQANSPKDQFVIQ